MDPKVNAAVVHGLAIFAGVLGIVAAASSSLGIPSYWVGVIGVVIAVSVYLANQISSLGSDPAKP